MVMTDTAPADTPTVGRIEQLRQSLSSSEWRRVRWMVGSIIALHVIGFGVFVAFVVPYHYKGLGIGVSVLAYTLGLRHAFDADHISAIDNTTRKLMNERRGVEGSQRPLSVGYWFSLGHSTHRGGHRGGHRDRREGRVRRGLGQPLGASSSSGGCSAPSCRPRSSS